MSGDKAIKAAVAVAALALLGFGCGGKTNPTPFALPTEPPPAPVANAVLPGPTASTSTAEGSDVPVTVYLVALGGTPAGDAASSTPGANGFGCGDWSVPVRTVTQGDPIAPMKLTIERLLSFGQDDAEKLGYRTALAESSVTLDGISKQDDGTYVVALKGQFVPAGECDDPRIKEQVERTIGQFGKFRIVLNGSDSAWRCFGDLSGQCK